MITRLKILINIIFNLNINKFRLNIIFKYEYFFNNIFTLNKLI